MKLCFTPSAWEDYLWFQEQDRSLLKRLNVLIKDTLRSPFEGIGKPERLKADLTGYLAPELRARHRLKTADALPVGAARTHGCNEVWTNDHRLEAKLGLSGLIPFFSPRSSVKP